MKNKVALYMLIFSLVFLVACNKQSNDHSQDETMTIVTSFYPIYIHTINISKDIDNVEVINMTQPQTGCLHDYQLSPDNIKTLEESDVFVINGGGMEQFMDKIIDQLSDINIIDASENIDLIQEDNNTTNPHVWVSISGAIDQVEQISKELSDIDPVNKDKYLSNAREYIGKLQDLKKEMHAGLDNIPDKNIVTFHEAFSYFAKEFDFNIVATIVEESGSEPSAKDLAEIIERIKTDKVKAIFTEPQYTSKSADLISEESGVKLYSLDPVVTGDSNLDMYDDYINKMKENLKTLEEALR